MLVAEVMSEGIGVVEAGLFARLTVCAASGVGVVGSQDWQGDGFVHLYSPEAVPGAASSS